MRAVCHARAVWKRYRPPFASSAPAGWQTGSSSAARLYRRMTTAAESAQTAVTAARRSGVPTDQLESAFVELTAQAGAITEHLVILSRLPFAKRQAAYRPVRSQVDDVEKLAARIGLSAIDARGHGTITEGLREITERLEALDAARRVAEGDLPELDRRQLRHQLEAARESSQEWIRGLLRRGTDNEGS